MLISAPDIISLIISLESPSSFGFRLIIVLLSSSIVGVFISSCRATLHCYSYLSISDSLFLLPTRILKIPIVTLNAHCYCLCFMSLYIRTAYFYSLAPRSSSTSFIHLVLFCFLRVEFYFLIPLSLFVFGCKHLSLHFLFLFTAIVELFIMRYFILLSSV